MEYFDFELEIAAAESGGSAYNVSVLRSPAGEASAPMNFPFSELELQNRLQSLQIALLRSASLRRRVLSPETEQVQAFGRALFEALIADDVRTMYAISQSKAHQQGKGLRLKLRIQPPELAALPWEFLYDPNEADYISLSRGTPVVRYLELPQSVEPLAITPPLRILGMVAAPEDLPELDVAREKQRIEMALEEVVADGLVSLTWMEGQSWRDLQRELRQGPWHIFHFIGHGGFDRHADEGFLALADRRRQTYRCTATNLGRLLNDHPSLRLVVLNACEGATGSQHDLFSSTQATLVRRGIPAVLAMQYEITDTAAIELARTFYELLAEGAPVDDALAETRKAISFTAANTFEWGTPVLYMRAPDGVLFETREPAPERMGAPVKPTSAPGIPPELFGRLRQALARSEVFESDRTLRALFVDARLAAWREQLPDADSITDRVEATVDFLYDKRGADTEANALALLLKVLQERTDPADALFQEFGELAAQLGWESAATGSVARAAGDPTQATGVGADDIPPEVRPALAAAAPADAAESAPETRRGPAEVVEAPAGAETSAPGDQALPVSPTPLYILEGYGSQVKSVAFSPDGRLMATGSGGDIFSGDKAIRLWQMPDGNLEHKMEGHRGAVRSVAFSPDGRLLASGSDDSTVRLWRAADGQHQQTLEGEISAVHGVAFSPDGSLLASGRMDGKVCLWQVAEGREFQTLEGHTAQSRSVAFSPDGTLLASGGDDNSVRIWTLPEGEHLQTLEGHDKGVLSVAFSPDGTLLASGSVDGTIRLWQFPSGQHLQTLEGHTNWVESVAFAGDGTLLASGSLDGTIGLWQLPDGALLQTWMAHDGWTVGVESVAFSPDGTLLASAGGDKKVCVWQRLT